MFEKLIYLASFVFLLCLILPISAKGELVGWWRFNEGSGDIANDSSGNGHHEVIIGTPEWVVGPEGFGGALAFNPDVCVGVDCGVFDPTNGTGQFTVALWAYWDGTGTFMHFLTKSAGRGADTMMFQIELWGALTNPAEIDRLGLSYQGNISSYNSSSGSTPFSIMPKNEWVHLAFTFDGSYATVYVNGVDEEGPKPFAIGPDVDAPVYIGVSHPDEGRTFYGYLDEVRIYDKALTADEIQIVMVGGEGFPNAFAPDPADGSLYLDTWVNLSWRSGDFAVSHDVYLGENIEVVSNATPDSDVFRGNQAESPAGLTLEDVRVVHNDVFTWKDGSKKQDGYETPQQPRLQYTVAVRINETAEGGGTYTCQAMMEGYEDSMVTATIPFRIQEKAELVATETSKKDEEDEEKELPQVTSGGLNVQCPPEPQPEAITSDMRHIETIKLPERWPEESYKDDAGYYRVFYKVWWDESKSQLKSYTAYGPGRENLREAWVNKAWDRNGNPIYVRTYQRDENGERQQHGIFEEWYPGGRKKVESIYVNDRQCSSKWWNKDGTLTGESLDSGTAARIRTYYDEGTPKEESNYVFDVKEGYRLEHGTQKRWYENGQLKCEEEYKAGERHGVYKWYREDGKLASEVCYANGERDGTSTNYDKQGRKRDMYTFKKGKKHGPHRIWDENGALMAETNYKDDDLNGVETRYKDGKLISEIGYKNHEYHGDFKEYRSDGSLKSHHVYENGKLVKTIKDSWF